jgi:Flp pilus assembly protein TadG
MVISALSFVGRPRHRRGTVLPLVALTIVAQLSFLALAIDLGMVAISKTQAQQAADLVSLTAARSLNGSATGNYNQSGATTNAQNILSYNRVLGQPIQASQLQLTYGSYDYSQTTQSFSANYPPLTGSPTTAVTATVTTSSSPAAFGAVLGAQLLPTLSATAQAVHRPRDIALVMDLSGSMGFGSSLGFDMYAMTRTTNNPDTLIPTFGQYSSSNAVMIGPSTNRTSAYDSYTISPSNTTAPNPSYTQIYVNSYYQNAAYASTLIRAFDSYTSTDGGNTWSPPSSGTPVLPGDVPLFLSGSTSTYAKTVQDVVGSAPNILWELDGYSAYAGGKPDTSGTGSTPQVWAQTDYRAPASPPANGSLPFNGYTQGPGYYGKTFFLWPPDPRTTTGSGQYVPPSAILQSYLIGLGISNSTDQTTLSNIWSTWQGQGATGLTNLQNWLEGTAKGGASSLPQISGGNYTSTKVSGFTTWNGTAIASANQPSTYNAMCRLFNRAYPGGAAWTSTSFSADWRMRFFGTNVNTNLFNSNGSLNTPGGSTYTINYNEILRWMALPPNPLPQQLRGGRIKYYGSIPTAITGTWPSYGSTDQQFWVEYIDNVLGFRQMSAGNYQDISGMTGYGIDFTWGTILITPGFPSANQYMSYADSPARPLVRYWFGPLMVADYLRNDNMNNLSNYDYMQPGDGYDAPTYTAKEAYNAAISTMQNEHPNDWVTLVPYSMPRTSATAAWGRHNNVACPLGTNYNYASSALLFPFSTINADGSPNSTEITPYDPDPATGLVFSANFVETARPNGPTCFAMALMLAYNQFAVTPSTDATLRTFVSSSPITFPTGMAGGMGRKGSQKVVIFETDGLADCMASANLVNAGTYSYYQIRYDMNNPSSSEYPSVIQTDINDSSTLSQVYTLVQQLVSTYNSARNPFRLYTLGFGPVFQGTLASEALSTLQTMQYYAKTQDSPSTPLAASQIVTGTDAQMSANMVNAFTSILESGVQIALIK